MDELFSKRFGQWPHRLRLQQICKDRGLSCRGGKALLLVIPAGCHKSGHYDIGKDNNTKNHALHDITSSCTHHVLIMYSFVLCKLYSHQLLGVVAGQLDAGLTPSPWQERLVEAEQVADSGGKSVCSDATKVNVEMTSEFLKLLKVLVFVSCHKTILDDPLSSECNYCNLSGWYINRYSIQ